MSTVVKTRIVKIGNSQGIRIPKILLEQSALGEEVELTLEAEQIVIRSARSVRQGWEDAFQSMAARGDDGLLDGETLLPTAWDEEEWAW